MTATIGINLRLPADVYEALDRAAPRGQKTQFIIDAVRRELTRRGQLRKPEPPTKGKR